MINPRFLLNIICTDLKVLQKQLKKAAKSRRKNNADALRDQVAEAASVLEESLAKIEPELFCKPGVTKHKFDELIETSACYKCGCKEGVLVQWLSPTTGRGLKRFSVVCANCWNITIRENDLQNAIKENNSMNHTLKQ